MECLAILAITAALLFVMLYLPYVLTHGPKCRHCGERRSYKTWDAVKKQKRHLCRFCDCYFEPYGLTDVKALYRKLRAR